MNDPSNGSLSMSYQFKCEKSERSHILTWPSHHSRWSSSIWTRAIWLPSLRSQSLCHRFSEARLWCPHKCLYISSNGQPDWCPNMTTVPLGPPLHLFLILHLLPSCSHSLTDLRRIHMGLLQRGCWLQEIRRPHQILWELCCSQWFYFIPLLASLLIHSCQTYTMIWSLPSPAISSFDISLVCCLTLFWHLLLCEPQLLHVVLRVNRESSSKVDI